MKYCLHFKITITNLVPPLIILLFPFCYYTHKSILTKNIQLYAFNYINIEDFVNTTNTFEIIPCYTSLSTFKTHFRLSAAQVQ